MSRSEWERQQKEREQAAATGCATCIIAAILIALAATALHFLL